ncbi:hypothetical protein G7Y89_g1786 [Cudoniella acicularis]|uniref:Low temperature requirement A n=1 Tax=Cudoniella acicularis TaxID=354080 RepID=A0A8H4RWE7_9HELO|nr:hypothetical protein G7Y89_g1786 [Cudoniella acicularis]
MDPNQKHRNTSLKLIATPLLHSTHQHGCSIEMHARHGSRSERAPEESMVGLKHQPTHNEGYQKLPEFHRHEEATNIELFYDLFFVANLASFSSVHEINDNSTLTSYVGFFCVLWFTWCQMTMFDVRYVADSILERLAKAIHLGVMVGLAVVGPGFDPSNQKEHIFRTMAFILMISRVVLALQYLLVMWHVRRYQNTKMPFIIISTTNFVAAIIYLGVAFAFKGNGGKSVAHRSFYVIAVFEIAINIFVSSRWKVASFKGTHLTQRMSLLTLIILGEGVIEICKTISKLVNYHNAWNSATVGCVIASISIIYFLYMLYFDALPPHHFGSIRQQFWAFLHFPLHLAIVLFLVGASQFFIWNKIQQVMVEVSNEFNVLENTPDFITNLATNNTQSISYSLGNLTSQIFNEYKPSKDTTEYNVDDTLAYLAAGYEASQDTTTFHNATDWILFQIATIQNSISQSIYENYGFSVSQKVLQAYGDDDTEAAIFSYLNSINLVFCYFFIATGFTLILLGILDILTLPRAHFNKGLIKNVRIVVSTTAYFAVGAIMCGFVGLRGTDAGNNLGKSPWILIVAAVAVVIVAVVRFVSIPGAEKGD